MAELMCLKTNVFCWMNYVDASEIRKKQLISKIILEFTGGFIYPNWLFGNSSFNSMILALPKTSKTKTENPSADFCHMLNCSSHSEACLQDET